jgi:MFS transporter, FSR family, fosmidomycin resistance protein
MKSKTMAIARPIKSDFRIADVSIIAGGHLIHDIFTAFVAPLLPEIIRILQISLTQAGTLSAFLQVPSILNPIIGYMDDRRNIRLLMILTPGVTATLLSLMGLAPNYASLVFLFLIAGVSIAGFHATAPGRLARISGNNIGLGMSFFMGGGELGRTLGPILAVWAVSIFSIRGIVPLSILGWIASFILWLRFKDMEVEADPHRKSTRIFPNALKFFIPVTIIVMFRGLMISGLGLYLPTFLTREGANLWAAGSALAIYQLAGSAGALAGGTLSDHLGRRKVLTFTMTGSSLLLLIFLGSSGWLTFPILILIGFLNLTLQPIMLALVQDHFPNQRSMANGIYMALNFIAFSVTSVVVGALGDWLGLRTAFFWCGLVSLLALPMLFLIQKPAEA